MLVETVQVAMEPPPQAESTSDAIASTKRKRKVAKKRERTGSPRNAAMGNPLMRHTGYYASKLLPGCHVFAGIRCSCSAVPQAPLVIRPRGHRRHPDFLVFILQLVELVVDSTL